MDNTAFEEWYENANLEWQSPKKVAEKAWKAAVFQAADVPHEMHFSNEDPHRRVSISQRVANEIRKELLDE